MAFEGFFAPAQNPPQRRPARLCSAAMKVDLFDFALPPERIAQRPATPRDAARLLHVPAGDAPFQDRAVVDLPTLLRPQDLLVFNDARVSPARLLGARREAKIECLLHQRCGGADPIAEPWPAEWIAFARPAKKLRPGDVIRFGDEGFQAEMLERLEGGEVRLRFDRSGADLAAALARWGHMPLPPYVKRPDDAQDRADYQTLFARVEGAAAAPTAGLHFTPKLLDRLADRGVRWTTVTLLVGAGTFLPVKVDDTDDHPMHAEWGQVTAESARQIQDARAAGGRVVAVGTTSLRVIESAWNHGSEAVAPWSGETRLFLTPGQPIRSADALLTNFHLPRSTLFMLVCAFSGLERMRAAYAHAIEQQYRFYSYGDACLLERGA